MLATDEDKIPTSTVIEGALNPVMQDIDLVWMERQKGWPEEEERSFSGWLVEKKNQAGQYRLC